MRLLIMIGVLYLLSPETAASHGSVNRFTVERIAEQTRLHINLPDQHRSDPPVLQPDYANTQLKEEFADGPPVTRNGQIVGVFFVKDANQSEMCFNALRLFRRIGASRTVIAEDTTPRTINADLYFWFIDMTTAEFGLSVGDTILFEWELNFNDFFCGNNHVNHYFVRTKVGEPLPSVSGYVRVDLHTHSIVSDDIIHSGMHFGLIRQAGLQVGMQVACVTDHSPDITPSDWTYYLQQAALHSDGQFVVIPSHEITTDTDGVNQNPDDRIHLLGIGQTRLIPAPEECCADNSNTTLWPLSRALDSLTVQGAVALAAHPTDELSWPQGLQIEWSDANYDLALTYPAFLGLECFNERRTVFNNTAITEDYIYPYGWESNPNWPQRWEYALDKFLRLQQRYLGLPRRISLAGASDAHQAAYATFNAGGTVDMAANDNGLGSVHSLVYSPSGVNQTGVMDGLRQGAIVMTDGPAIRVDVDQDGNGINDGTVGGMFTLTPSAQLTVTGSSIAEFGNFTQARLISIAPADIETTTVTVTGMSLNLSQPAYELAVSGGWSALVVQVRTANGYQAIASPVYFAPRGATDVGDASLIRLALSEPHPNPMRNRTTFNLSAPPETSASIEVIDVSGRRVLAHNLGPVVGPQSFTWDGKDQSGVSLPAGLYFVRLVTPDATIQQKVVMVR